MRLWILKLMRLRLYDVMLLNQILHVDIHNRGRSVPTHRLLSRGVKHFWFHIFWILWLISAKIVSSGRLLALGLIQILGEISFLKVWNGRLALCVKIWFLHLIVVRFNRHLFSVMLPISRNWLFLKVTIESFEFRLDIVQVLNMLVSKPCISHLSHSLSGNLSC